ncbi:shikimate dehydrogenase [Patescibacteria group bacterium]|nr:shikimate dehydrogenase [Patescibacteria group bacterium]
MYFSVLLGKPVDHSISPKLFSLLGESLGIEYAHIKINVPSEKQLPILLDDLCQLGCSGINITLPYKIVVMDYIDASDLDARQIGAVNAIYFKGKKSIGFNSDAPAALLAIEKKLKPIQPQDSVVILGAGGAARAIASAIRKRTSRITIANRTLSKARMLAHDLPESENISFMGLYDKALIEVIKKAHYVINATSVGMAPNIAANPIDLSNFKGHSLEGKYFFDAIFNPYETKFLIAAKQRGAKTCSGMYMMIFQAVYALEKWTGKKPKVTNLEKINSILVDYLKKHA